MSRRKLQAGEPHKPYRLSDARQAAFHAIRKYMKQGFTVYSDLMLRELSIEFGESHVRGAVRAMMRTGEITIESNAYKASIYTLNTASDRKEQHYVTR